MKDKLLLNPMDFVGTTSKECSETPKEDPAFFVFGKRLNQRISGLTLDDFRGEEGIEGLDAILRDLGPPESE